MALNYQNNGNGTATITIIYTANKSKLDSALDDAAHYLWNTGYGDHGTSETPRAWESLSNGEKFALVDESIKRELLDKAKTYHVNASAEEARQTAQTESETRYF